MRTRNRIKTGALWLATVLLLATPHLPVRADVVCVGPACQVSTGNPNTFTALQTFTGWIQDTQGKLYLAANYTNATTTFSNVSMTANVTAGRKYSFKLVLFVSDSLAADGAKFDFNGGTATATDFRVHCTLFDTALLLSTQATALNTAISQATVTGSGLLECYGSFEPLAGGTFIPRAAQVAHTTGTLTVFRGSNLWLADSP